MLLLTGRSTTSLAREVVRRLVDARERQLQVALLCCDLSRAFDVADHALIAAKLDHYGIRDNEAGWGSWGAWKTCDLRRATEATEATDACKVARTPSDDVDNELYAMPAYRSNVEMASFVTVNGSEPLGVGGLVGCVLAAFVVGWLLCLASVVYCQRRGSRLPWSRKTRVPSSPHYITAKQNSYVTVPLKHVPRKAKRQPSFTGIGGPSGILLSKSNNINANNHNSPVAKLGDIE